VCSIFTAPPPGVDGWKPAAIFVDDAQQLVFVSDAKNTLLHAFSYDGSHTASIATTSAVIAMTFKPGMYAPLFVAGYLCTPRQPKLWYS